MTYCNSKCNRNNGQCNIEDDFIKGDDLAAIYWHDEARVDEDIQGHHSQADYRRACRHKNTVKISQKSFKVMLQNLMTSLEWENEVKTTYQRHKTEKLYT